VFVGIPFGEFTGLNDGDSWLCCTPLDSLDSSLDSTISYLEDDPFRESLPARCVQCCKDKDVGSLRAELSRKGERY